MTNRQRNHILRLYNKGLTIDEICGIMGLPNRNVYYTIQANLRGEPPVFEKEDGIGTATKEEIEQMLVKLRSKTGVHRKQVAYGSGGVDALVHLPFSRGVRYHQTAIRREP